MGRRSREGPAGLRAHGPPKPGPRPAELQRNARHRKELARGARWHHRHLPFLLVVIGVRTSWVPGTPLRPLWSQDLALEWRVRPGAQGGGRVRLNFQKPQMGEKLGSRGCSEQNLTPGWDEPRDAGGRGALSAHSRGEDGGATLSEDGRAAAGEGGAVPGAEPAWTEASGGRQASGPGATGGCSALTARLAPALGNGATSVRDERSCENQRRETGLRRTHNTNNKDKRKSWL